MQIMQIIISRFLIVALFLVLYSTNPLFVSGQTKEETRKFITEKATATLVMQDGFKWECKVTFDGDELLTYQKISKGSKGISITKCRVFLKDLNPKRVDILKDFSVQFWTTGNKSAIKRISIFLPSTREFDSASGIGAFAASDERTARQLGKALSHLIQLSGGKAELFEP